MPSSAVRFALVLSLAFAACLAQASPKPPSADSYPNQAVVIEKLDTTTKMNADGTGERDLHVVMRIQSQGAAQQFGDLSFAYASANETLHIKYVRVRKPDGTVVDTPPSDAINMPAPITRQAPLYSDLKEEQIPVRSLSAGDTLEYEVDTSMNKPEAPGQFWGTTHFTAPGTAIVLAEVFTLEVPADKYVQVWSPNHKPAITEQNGLRIYRWNVSQLLPPPKNKSDGSTEATPPKDPDEDANGRKLPSVAWTTFHNWAAVGAWYRSLELPQSKPTPAILARANQLTKDAKTPTAEVRALYNYVSTETRYIGIDFGIGRYRPHPAAEILTDQYGDCKDKDTLLEALLHAKGFTTAPALIGAGIAAVPQVPSPADFNHVITTVKMPGGRIWLDSTPDAAPFRYLSATLRAQKALVVPSGKPATLVTTPASAPYPFTERFVATGTLSTKDKMTAKMVVTYRDDDEIFVRILARRIAPAQWDKVSQLISSASGFGGTTSDTQFKNVNDPSKPIVLTYDYVRKTYGDWDDLRIVPLFPVLPFTSLKSDKKAPQKNIQLGAPRTLTAISTIHLPAKYQVNPPDPVHVKTDFATFDETYRYEKGEVIVERKLTVLKKKLPAADWKQYEAFTKKIGLTKVNWIMLFTPEKSAAVELKKPVQVTAVPASPGKNPSVVTLHLRPKPSSTDQTGKTSPPPPTSESAAELMQQAEQKIRTGDWSGAREKLDQVRAKNPQEADLWSGYALVAVGEDHNFPEAIADFHKELDAHPDNAAAASVLARMQLQIADSAGARHTLEAFLHKNGPNLKISEELTALQTLAGDYNGALKTLQAAAKQNPDSRQVQVMMSTVLVQLGRKQEAAAAAESALDGARNPGILNDAAYSLCQTGIDLNVAEAASRKGIAAVASKTAAFTTEQANTESFADSKLLVASWDTLGWILFHEGKLNEAEPYLVAAWRASQGAEVGYHLGRLYEALGEKKEAATTYALANTAIGTASTPDISGHIANHLARLKAAGIRPDATGVQALQKLRTYTISRPKGVSKWGAFRLEITTAGVIESQQMSGSDQIAGIKPALAKMKFAGLVPPGSKAHLLRSAVVSCTLRKVCEVVLVPGGGLQTERQ